MLYGGNIPRWDPGPCCGPRCSAVTSVTLGLGAGAAFLRHPSHLPQLPPRKLHLPLKTGLPSGFGGIHFPSKVWARGQAFIGFGL